MQTYDVIVIGTGGVGSAALYHLAKRGVKVLGLDRFPPGHDRGSSHGRTRIIRQAYFEHPGYVPLLQSAYKLWQELSKISGKSLYHETGVLYMGPPSRTIVKRVIHTAHINELQVTELSGDQCKQQFPGFNIPDEWKTAFEPQAGYLDVEDCVLAHLVAAQKHGATLQAGVSVLGWSPRNNSVRVITDAGVFEAGKLIIAAGPWANSMLSDLGIRFDVLRAPVFWYPIHDERLRADRGCPCYLFDIEGYPYGIPQVDAWGFKVAEHGGAREKKQVADPLTVSRELEFADQNRAERFLSQYIPGISRPFLHHGVCMYTMSPLEEDLDGYEMNNFVVDLHPRYPQVSFAAGLSGHGFKFTCVLGEILADLALDGRTAHPINFLNCRRFGTI